MHFENATQCGKRMCKQVVATRQFRNMFKNSFRSYQSQAPLTLFSLALMQCDLIDSRPGCDGISERSSVSNLLLAHRSYNAVKIIDTSKKEADNEKICSRLWNKNKLKDVQFYIVLINSEFCFTAKLNNNNINQFETVTPVA